MAPFLSLDKESLMCFPCSSLSLSISLSGFASHKSDDVRPCSAAVGFDEGAAHFSAACNGNSFALANPELLWRRVKNFDQP